MKLSFKLKKDERHIAFLISVHLSTHLTRSLGMVTPNWMTNEFIIKESVMGGASIAALSQQGDILAVRLGCVRNRDQVELSKGHRKVTFFSDWSTQSCNTLDTPAHS